MTMRTPPPDPRPGAGTPPDEDGDAPALGRLARIEAWALRAPIAVPVVTSFGAMRDRPAVFVRVTGDDGVQGWGEAWCNFPGVGAEHRARLLVDAVAPLALRACAAPDGPITPPSLWRTLTARLHVLALQTGEPGPLAQGVAAIDQACWDLVARRARLPLWRVLMPRGAASPVRDGAAVRVRVYASGLHPDAVLDLAPPLHAQGHRAFKMKVGFDARADARRLGELRQRLGEGATLMVDANQAWSPAQAAAAIAPLLPMRPLWVEEPIAADRPWPDWIGLRQRLGPGAPALAAGENVRGEGDFDALVAAGAVSVVQPDIGKWGGLSACRAVARRAEAQGRVFCPHWLGGPIGLLGSMHLRAALDGAHDAAGRRAPGRDDGPMGCVEWDANPNPVHERVADQLPRVADGRVTLDDRPGTGLELDDPGRSTWSTWVTWQGSAEGSGRAA